MKGIFNIRRLLNSFPARMIADNAIFTPRSASLAFLKENNVEVTHGMAYISRCQSHAERMIGTLTRLVTKLHTDSPTTQFVRLVDEACIIINNSPSDGLPKGLTPKEIVFSRPTKSFLHIDAKDEEGRRRAGAVSELMTSARRAERNVRHFKVSAFLKRQQTESPTNYTRRLRIGDFALKRRTSFPTGSAKKLCFKLNCDGFEIMSRVASNSYRVRSVMDGQTYIYPGDHLVKVRGYDNDSLKRLVTSMIVAAERNTASIGRRQTRSRAIRQINVPLFATRDM